MLENKRVSNQKGSKDGGSDQLRRFKETARVLECDESEERFDDALRTIAKQKPHRHKTKKRKA